MTGEEDTQYNCIAFTVDRTDVHFVSISNSVDGTKIGIDETYGDSPNGVLDNDDITAFYEDYGFTVLTKERKGEADVIFYTKFHAAKKKQCSCGDGKWSMWESKLGVREQIEHRKDQLNGNKYGTPERLYFKKQGN